MIVDDLWRTEGKFGRELEGSARSHESYGGGIQRKCLVRPYDFVQNAAKSPAIDLICEGSRVVKKSRSPITACAPSSCGEDGSS